MKKEFRAIIPCTPEECKQIIRYGDFGNVHLFPFSPTVYGRVRFIDEYDFHVSLRRVWGKITGTIQPFGQNQTEIKAQLEFWNCIKLNIPIALLMIMVAAFLEISMHGNGVCLAFFVLVPLPMFIIVSRIQCAMEQTTGQRIIDGFIKSLEDQASLHSVRTDETQKSEK